MKPLLILLALTLPVHAADKVLILNDQQQTALRQVLDAAIRNSGLSTISRNAIGLSDMLDAAGVITDQKSVTPVEPKDKPQ